MSAPLLTASFPMLFLFNVFGASKTHSKPIMAAENSAQRSSLKEFMAVSAAMA